MITQKNGPRRPITATKVILAAIVLVGVVAGGFALYALAALNVAYSEGERSGLLQKFSRRGWVCKTWEGEIAMSFMPGMAPVIWDFTVRDDDVAAKVNEGLGKNVVLHYHEHRGVPTSCFGETQYFVDSLRVLQ